MSESDDVAALIADMERGASANLNATDVRMHEAAAMLRRLSAPAGGDDARLCRALRLSPGEWESIELLNEDAAARIEQLSAEVEWLRLGKGKYLATHTQIMDMQKMRERAEAAELLAQQHGERIAELEHVLHNIPDIILSPAYYGDTPWGKRIRATIKEAQ